MNGKAKLLIDSGPGSSLHFEKSDANFNDLTAVLYTHFHVDHSSDLPAFIKAGYFTGRNRDLYLYGPTGNELAPSATNFVNGMFGSEGLYRYLSEYVRTDLTSQYKIRPFNIDAGGTKPTVITLPEQLTATAIPVHHGPIPALAWRIDADGCSATFSGDTNNIERTLEHLALNTDLFIVHHAIPENSGTIARNLDMRPSVIGTTAHNAFVKKLLLSHRMLRTEGGETETLTEIRKAYSGPVEWAEDNATYFPCQP